MGRKERRRIMTILLEIVIAVVISAFAICLFAMMLTLAFDTSIPEIIEWWDERKENRK